MNRRVAVILHQTIPWLAECVAGIRRYADQKPDWHLVTIPPGFRRFGYTPTFSDIHHWKGDAIIGLVDDEAELRAAAKLGIPVVNLGSWLPQSFGIPRVMVDHFKGGELAADHLLDLGLRHLAVFGWKDAWYLARRRTGFVERARQSGVKCDFLTNVSRDDATKSWYQRIAEPARWLATLPLPCGVFAMHDYMAQLVSEACHEANLRIPDDIALIGMDNDVTICEHLIPPLTSVGRNSEQVGWEAAALLDRLMQGESSPGEDRLVKPDGVIARRSTDRLYSADPLVQQALDEMRENLSISFNIEELAGRLGVSKRTLETRFRERLQRSPHDFLTRLRVRRVQALVKMPRKRTVEQLASESGFGSAQALRKAYSRVTGETLSAHRGVERAARAAVMRVAESHHEPTGSS